MNKPNCFGVWWEAAAGPSGASCRQCTIKDDCLAEFATTTLPAAQEHLGGAGDLAALATHLDVAEQAVLVAMAHGSTGARAGRPRPRQTPVVPAPPSAEILTHIADGGLAAASPDGKTWVKDKPKPSKKPKRKKTKLKRKTKKKTRKSSAGGKQTHEARWDQERERNPLIAQLTPGTKLEKQYKGAVRTAVVRKGGYEYEEQTFPTLSALTRHIVGKPGYVAIKFWGLKRAEKE